MRKLKLIGFLMIIASSLMFIQCTSDPIAGPQGEAGIDGINGVNGTNGVDGTDGTATCVACHTKSHREPIDASYKLSGHAGGGAVGYAGGRNGCAQCHSNEGFIDFVTTGATSATGYTGQGPIGCATCHNKHSTFDFENDGDDYALRTFDPVTLITDASYTIDFGDTSNTCANCHQPRRTEPLNDGEGMFTVTSSHWGPHHGPQATFLEGIQGAHIVGSVAYPVPQAAAHRTGSTCVSCHMGETTDGNDGAHSWIATTNACTSCHGATAPTTVNGLEADMAALETLLENVVGWEYQYEVDANGDLIRDANGDYILVLDINGDPVINDVHGIIHDGHPNNGSQGRGATFAINEAQAAWNYLLIMEDASKGIHNPVYAKALITNSLEAFD